MKILDTILYLEFIDLVNAGVSELTIKTAKCRNRSSWSFIKDPADGRKVLVHYESLKDKYKELIQAKYGDPRVYLRNITLKKHLKPDAKASEYYRSLEIPVEYVLEYTKCAEWLNMILAVNDAPSIRKVIGLEQKTAFWEAIIQLIKAENVDLPTSYSGLMRKIDEYKAKSYAALVSGKFGNTNTQKINEAAAEWLINKYSSPLKPSIEMIYAEYCAMYPSMGWKPIKDSRTIELYLKREGIEEQWYAARHGVRAYESRYSARVRTLMPSYRDAVWYGDGTGWNYMLSDVKRQLICYMVIDAYSDMILGWAVGASENADIQYRALKMAVEFSKHKPYEFRYDNQGGHGTADSQRIFEQIAHVNFPTMPNNPSSKTIENFFGRFQTQVQRKDWFYNGQNLTTKKEDSAANFEFLSQKRQDIPTLAEALVIFQQRVNEWNNMPHHKSGVARVEMYLNSINPNPIPVHELDMVEIFWKQSKMPITYRADGLRITIEKQEYIFEKLTNGMPDGDFRRKYVGKRFIVKYNPDDMSYVALYDNTPSGMLFIEMLEPKPTVHRALAEQTSDDNRYLKAIMNERKEERASLKDKVKKQWSVVETSPAMVAKKQSLAIRSIYDDISEDDFKYEEIF